MFVRRTGFTTITLVLFASVVAASGLAVVARADRAGAVRREGPPARHGAGRTTRTSCGKSRCPGQEEKAGQDQNQSSPVVSRGRVFVTASYWPGGKADPKQIPEHHVACYRAADGKLLWDVKVKPGPWLFADLRGGYTAPTPAADAERVYVVFGSAVIAALDHDGQDRLAEGDHAVQVRRRPRRQPGAVRGDRHPPVRPGRQGLAAGRVRPQDRRDEVGGEAADGRVQPQHAGRRRDRREAATARLGVERGPGRGPGDREGAVVVRGEGRHRVAGRRRRARLLRQRPRRAGRRGRSDREPAT